MFLMTSTINTNFWDVGTGWDALPLQLFPLSPSVSISCALFLVQFLYLVSSALFLSLSSSLSHSISLFLSHSFCLFLSSCHLFLPVLLCLCLLVIEDVKGDLLLVDGLKLSKALSPLPRCTSFPIVEGPPQLPASSSQPSRTALLPPTYRRFVLIGGWDETLCQRGSGISVEYRRTCSAVALPLSI